MRRLPTSHPAGPGTFYQKALTFPVAVAPVKRAWEAGTLVPAAGWFPLVARLLIGVIITIDNLMAQKKVTLPMRVMGLFISVLNSLVMFAAVLGLSR